MDSSLQHRLSRVGRRFKTLHLGWSLALLWLGFAGVGIALVLARRQGSLAASQIPWFWLITLSVSAFGLVVYHMLRPTNLKSIARKIEDRFPSLNEELITATDVRPNAQGEYGFLQRSVVAMAIRHDVRFSWARIVSTGQVLLAWLSNLPALGCLLLVALALWKSPARKERVVEASLPVTPRLTEVEVEPGDTEIERNTSLIVTARFNPDETPDQVWLETVKLEEQLAGSQESDSEQGGENLEAGQVTRRAMRQSLQDPIFAAYINNVDQALRYRVVYDEQKTSEYRVNVFDYPALVRADALLRYPEYTGLPEKMIIDTRRVVAAKGTVLTWKLELNKAVVSAELLCDEDEPVVLHPIAPNTSQVAVELPLEESRDWRLRLVDQDGRENPTEYLLRAKVLPNKESTIRLTAGGDTVASPLEELNVKAKIKDDFAIQAAGIGFQLGGGEIIEKASFTVEEDRSKMRELDELIDLESLAAKPRDLLSYYVWAEDIDETGESRRVVSDMYFAEIRPFEEIYREGDQPQSGQQQQQQGQQQGGNEQTEELLELQRDIVVSTWNTMKLGRKDKLIGRAEPDIITIRESQQQAIQLLEQKAEEANVEGASDIIAATMGHMTAAAERLGTAADSLSKADLQKALSSEQAAYQELLRLQNQEFEVSQQQQQSQPSASSSRARQRQQQIDQLKLDNEMNRYEQERLAQEEQNPEQAELRQIISRLRELASRQEDINQQLRTIEAALQAAETEEEKEELERQLERLREQQQEMLQDSDEVQEQIASSENEAVQELQEKMEQARENLQQSNESLRQENPSQALASGTRAEQELSDLREEARQQAANQFSESMQSMKQRATDLEQRQEAIVESLEDQQDEASPGLRADDQDANVAEAVAEQQQRLESLLEEMQQTVLESEESEPLLAEKLYESYRRAQQEQAEERLDVTRQLLERDLTPQARELAEESIVDLKTLREEIDEAAESVLGSEVQSLRRALDQIDQLSDDLDAELSAATGEPRGQNEEGEPGATPNSQGASDGRRQEDEEPANAEEGPQGQGRGDNAQSQEDSASEREQPQERSGQPGGQQAGGSPGGSPSQDNDSQTEGQQGGQTSEESEATDRESQPSNEESEQNRSSESSQEGQQAEGQGQRPGESQQPGQGGQRPGEAQGNRSDPRNTNGENATPGQRNAPSPGLRGTPSTQGQTNPAQGSSEMNLGPGNARPLTGEEFREWSDRLRDVEELVVDPELRWQATQIRQSARDIRRDFKKHGVDPRWAEVEDLVAEPLRELKQKVSQELIRRAAEKTEIVPIDRDPVPAEFSRSVREYYENLGIGLQ